MPSSIYTVTIDCADPGRLGAFWSAVLGFRVAYANEEEVAVEPSDGCPALLFLKADDAKSGKNRVHLDLDPDHQDAEVERLLGLGATRADIGQGERSWVVMADPEGNEFCVLTPRGE